MRILISNDDGILAPGLVALEKIARTLTLAPVLFAGLISCLPLLIPCIACRGCKELFVHIRRLIDA